MICLFPSKEKAFAILHDAEHSNPGLWVGHSITAACCAEKIAKACAMESEKAYVFGLLHDIGRKYGISHFGHIVDGYRYMMSLEYPEVARICLTHSFARHKIEDYVGKFDVPACDIAEMKAVLRTIKYDEYDKLIQLCDCLSGPEGVVDMQERMRDVARRYGNYPQALRAENQKLKEHFEMLSGKNIYEIVSENRALWKL
ncbi:MAG: HD domain-containing protein [Ruthenibacterium sp.]